MTIVKDPVVLINGTKIAYVGGTFTYTNGIAERTVNIDSNGGSHITEDASTAKSKVSFELYTNPENEAYFRQWILNGSNNTISFMRGDAQSNCANMTVTTTNIDIKYGSDESFEVMFEGNPVVQ